MFMETENFSHKEITMKIQLSLTALLLSSTFALAGGDIALLSQKLLSQK